MVFQSCAKLNLYLEVLRKRKDNYHDIKSLFERISLSDTITFSCRRDKKIKITCSHPDVPEDNSNLCYKAAKLLQDKFCISCGVNIKITKRIPVAAGLGGGSSNAASVFLGLNRLWRLNISRKKLSALAAKVGSDLPFFIYQAPLAMVGGRGEIIRPLKFSRRPKLWHILVVPELRVSTPVIYQKYDRICAKKSKIDGLTRAEYNVKILALGLRKNRPDLIIGNLLNSLEQATFSLYPRLRKIKQKLITLGARAALMSGSGPAIFGITSSKKQALGIAGKLRKAKCRCRIFVVSTV